MEAGGNQAQKRLGAGGRRHGFGAGQDPNIGRNTQFKKGQSGNPAGKPKGLVHMSTRIQQMMNDPRFIEKLSATIKDKAKLPDNEFQGTPMDAIITAAMVEAMSTAVAPQARQAARDYLTKYGWGSKVEIEGTIRTANPYAELTADELRKLAQEG